VDGKTVGVDSTMLEASAAIRSIVRKDSGEDYKEYLKQLANEAGIEEPGAWSAEQEAATLAKRNERTELRSH
jgi:hypothetical protein